MRESWASRRRGYICSAPDNVYEEARGQFAEKELADLSILIAMINAWNRLAIGLRSVHPADSVKAA